MAKELQGLNKLIKKCQLYEKGTCRDCPNEDICHEILEELSPMVIAKRLEELNTYYSRIK